MPLQPIAALATGYIVPNRFVMMDISPLASQVTYTTPLPATTTLGGAGGFHIIQAVAQGTSVTGWSGNANNMTGSSVGISADGTNYPPINDPSIFPSGILGILAAPGQWCKIFCAGSSDVLLEMAAACNIGDFLAPVGGNINQTLSAGALGDNTSGRGTPLNIGATSAGLFYGARALQFCTGGNSGVGNPPQLEKIRVEIIEGMYTHS
jgi:hypothetical protein